MNAVNEFAIPHRWSKKYPQFGTGPLSIEPIISEEVFKLERDKIFRKAWLQVCREEDLPEKGSFFTRHIELCNVHVLVSRGEDGKIRAFHNVCSHRLNKLVWDEQGKGKFHACKFHGWVYNSSGQLVDVPDEGNFFELNKKENGLEPIHLDIWQGFIFICLDPQPEQTLPEFLGDVVGMLDGYKFDKFSLGYGYKSRLKCNWKIAVDSQQEAYHAVTLHRRTLGDICVDKNNPYMHALDIQFMGPHRMISLPFPAEYNPTPMAEVSARYAWTIKKKDHGVLDLSNMPKGVNPTRAKNWLFDIYLIWPNFWIAVFDGAYQTHNFWPTGLNSMYQEIKMHVIKPTTNGEMFALEHAKAMNRDTWVEDFSTLETTQTVLHSGAKKHFILQDEEILIRHFYKTLQEQMST